MSEDSDPEGLKEMLADAASAPQGFDWGEAGEESGESEVMTLLLFRRGRQRYAIAGEDVREVLAHTQSTELPGAPPHIRGIMVHRRQVVGLLDLERWFGLEESVEPEAMARIVILEHQALLAGLLVDASTSIVQWSSETLRRSIPDTIPKRVIPYIKAIRDEEEGSVLLLDVARLLEDASMKS